jgi:hypothetical protein
MKRAIILVMLATCAGGAFAQDEDHKIRNRPNYDSHRPAGATDWPPTPYDPKDETAFGRPAEPRRAADRSSNSEQNVYVERSKDWRRMRDRQQNPLGVNLSGDPDARSYVPSSQPRRYGTTTEPYSGRSTSGSSSYNDQPRPRYTPPATYGEAVRRDNSWLRPNFGTAPRPAPAPTYRPTPQPTHRSLTQCLGKLYTPC